MPENEGPGPVGYKNPPRRTRFKPGQSGNLKGRPKGSKNFATVFAEELRAPIEVTENGKRKRISKRQAIAKQNINRAVAGDPKATVIVLNEVRLFENPTEAALAQSAFVPQEDQMVMQNMLQRIRHSILAVPSPESQGEGPSEDQLDPSSKSNPGGL